MSMSNTNFAAILKGMPQPYLVLDTDLMIVGASDAYLALTDRSLADIVGQNILVAFPENPDAEGTVEQGPLEVSLRHVIETGKPHEMAVIQYDIPQPGGGFMQKFWTPVHTPVTDDDGEVEYIIQNPMDVTESVLKAKEADARLRVALHAADLASWEYEPETDIWRRSHSVDVIFGFEPGEGGPLAAPFFARMHPDDLLSTKKVVADVMDCPDRTAMKFDYRILLPSGEVRHVTSRGEVLRTSTGKVRMIGVLMDVTADRIREAELSAALAAQAELIEQKELLLAEVNHRVKNSLQLVISTLRLQARKLRDPATNEAFARAISRVRAIISVHERLYRNHNSLSVDMADHLSKLCLDLVGDGPKAIIVDADALELPTERAIPISVIVNELLAGALRGADEQNPITVSLKTTAEGQIELTVSGSDVASPMGSDELGGRLIATMASQLGGVVAEANAPDGYRFMLAFEGNDR
ncbi:sensor histidine kinase [Rhizobium sp. B21/90]|uniref:sensor histidine kinase n=1 Tax=Rhizobium sp. B21/90 TaxID=2819993 RepID=UPI001C5AF1C2|nr:histidine kinase dimerization/phosphoacceptor domain -containing protein [Rhizobium sp. B21/90]QYA04692.1 PAS domain-containing protein [Rhizobium sp. B21/90]